MQLEKRREIAVQVLDSEIQVLAGDASKTSALARRRFQEALKGQNSIQKGAIQDRISSRLDQDFAKYTQFQNFAEYKAYVMQFPQYRALVKEFSEKTTLMLARHQGRRTSILLNGFRNGFEDEFSEPLGVFMVYTEAQVYGFLGIGDVEELASSVNEKTTPSLAETYKKPGIQLHTYKPQY